MICIGRLSLFLASRSRKGAWIEINRIDVNVIPQTVAPARERGLKFFGYDFRSDRRLVAPARERGLKFVTNGITCKVMRRSRKGAWIEIRLRR